MPRRRLSLIVVAVMLVAVTAGCLGAMGDEDEEVTVDAPEPYTDAEVAFIVDGEERGTLAVEVADTPQERARGLMGRETLPDGTGMLFVYPEADERSFWMKNTLVPLDMVFVDAEMRVVNVEHASTEPDTPDDELTRYTSDGAAMYVVEAERGYANETGVSRGDELVVRR